MKTPVHKKICFLLFLQIMTSVGLISAREESKNLKSVQPPHNTRMILSGCANPAAQEYLDINNVRTMILTGGDLWWDGREYPHYEIPKGSGINCLFTGGTWIGGLDAGNNLKMAAQTYRQNGYDFWPGPLTDASIVDSAGISSADCYLWDKHFKINSQMIDEFRHAFLSGKVASGEYIIPATITNWPAHGEVSKGQAKYLAPFFDYNGDGNYDPTSGGDYPLIYGNQAIWWVINDKGNSHTETGGSPMGLEIQNMAFAYQTTYEVNDMTFYSLKIINRSTTPLYKTYLGQWTDADLGNYLDDYVGCDVSRGIGFCYNGDNNDESVPGTPGYGANPPAIGLKFFKGPKADSGDSIDNNRDGIIDENDEQIIMSNFYYYNNSADPLTGNPNGANHFYNYLRSKWGNGTPCTYDLKYGTSPVSDSTPATNFMFPGNSDPTGQWTGKSESWNEVIAGNPPGDRRFLMSAGPFTLSPGEIKEAVFGVIWARDTDGGPSASVQKMKDVSDALNFSLSTYYSDTDNDGFGDPAFPIQDYIKPQGYSSSATDCNDTLPSVYPGAVEILDSLDNNCDGKVDNTVSINDVNNPNSMFVQIFPNPSTENLNIVLNNKMPNENFRFSIYEMNGKIIFTKQLSMLNIKRELSIDISNFKQGVYQLVLESKNLKKREKFMILR